MILCEILVFLMSPGERGPRFYGSDMQVKRRN